MSNLQSNLRKRLRLFINKKELIKRRIMLNYVIKKCQAKTSRLIESINGEKIAK
jgi:hypothetical protein